MQDLHSSKVMAALKFETWICEFCGWVLKFYKGRTDVSTWCDKCHTDMEKIG